MEPIRLWRSWDATCALQPFDVKRSREYDDEYAALPRADFDALVKRAENASVAYRAIGEERDKWERLATDLGVERKAAARERDAATARADKASERLARAEALLREAAPFLDKWRKGYPLGLRGRIDALLEGKA